jgi:hypothetical protein
MFLFNEAAVAARSAPVRILLFTWPLVVNPLRSMVVVLLDAPLLIITSPVSPEENVEEYTETLGSEECESAGVSPKF